MLLQDRESHREAQYKSIKADAEKIHSLVQENLNYFQAEADSQHWRNYVDYLDDVVLDGLFECVQCSLLYLKENTDKEREMPPLMMAKLELQVSRIVMCMILIRCGVAIIFLTFIKFRKISFVRCHLL